jgi:hypothetical protein
VALSVPKKRSLIPNGPWYHRPEIYRLPANDSTTAA